MIAELLKMPSKQPSYRENRTHEKFLTNLCRPAAELKQILRDGWNASSEFEGIPDLSELLGERYNRADWNYKF